MPDYGEITLLYGPDRSRLWASHPSPWGPAPKPVSAEAILRQARPVAPQGHILVASFEFTTAQPSLLENPSRALPGPTRSAVAQGYLRLQTPGRGHGVPRPVAGPS